MNAWRAPDAVQHASDAPLIRGRIRRKRIRRSRVCSAPPACCAAPGTRRGLDFNPITEYSPSVRSARGRSHEASCGWDRMRRLRACLAKHALGRRRGSARRPLGAARQELADGGRPQAGRPRKARPGCRKENAAMARREAPAFSRGNAARQNNGCATWRAIPLIF